MHHAATGGLRLQLIGEHLLIVPMPLEAQAEPQAVAKDAHCLAAGPELVNFIVPTASPNSNSQYVYVCVCVHKVCVWQRFVSCLLIDRGRREKQLLLAIYFLPNNHFLPLHLPLPLFLPLFLYSPPPPHSPCLSLIQQFQFQLAKLDSEMRRTIYTFFVAYFCAFPSSLRQRSFRLMSFVIMPSWIYNYASSNAK